MTLGTLLIYIGITALVLTLLIGFLHKRHKSWVMTFLQNFTGVLFLVSGWVKAVDPMGTAFKMEQYFAEFEATFEGTWFDFAAPMFPWLSEHAIAVSVVMIVLEIVVGLMLVIGHRTRLTSWVFLLIVGFFTLLTGFTFLTGYVPAGENFFAFSKWGPYTPSNMRVTDCGCFGDFIKLEPRTSFLKDVVLLIPAVLFVFRHRHMHRLFTATVRSGLVGAAVIGLLIYCFSNYMWDLPHADFRPFKVGVDIAERKAVEEEAAANVQVIAWKLKNKEDGRIVELPTEVYLNDLASYPGEEWEVVEQIKNEPEITATKISDFEILASDGTDMTADILEAEDPLVMIVCYKLKGRTQYVEQVVQDTVFRMDTVSVEGTDSVRIVQVVDQINETTESVPQYYWDADYVSKFEEAVIPFVRSARNDGVGAFLVAGGASGAELDDFAATINADFPMYEADDITLKTIIRSNPGIVLLHDGTIVNKWHYRKIPQWNVARTQLPR